MIENKIELKNYLTELGLTPGSNSSYRSRLNFLVDHKIDINSNLVNPNNLLALLAEKQINYQDKSSLKSALIAYKGFLSSDHNLLQDLNKIESENLSPTEKELLIKARIGQGKYREELIILWKKCSISELNLTELLIASHILPWRNATNAERLNKYNGLLLQPNFDKMFDKGYISFTDNGSIILSKKIDEKHFAQLGISGNAKLYKIHDENIPFLKQHREIFKEVLF